MALAWSSPSRHVWAPFWASDKQIWSRVRGQRAVVWGTVLNEEWEQAPGKRTLWGCGSCLQVFEGLSWGRKIRLLLKGLQGVEIKVTDGKDRQSDVSSIHERLLHEAELERWEDGRSLSPAYPRTGKLTLWWQCWGRNSRIDEQEDSILLKASDGSENPILWSIYTLSDQIWLEITMQLVTLAPSLHSVPLNNFTGSKTHSLYAVPQGSTCNGSTSVILLQTQRFPCCALNRPDALPPSELSSGCSLSKHTLHPNNPVVISLALSRSFPNALFSIKAFLRILFQIISQLYIPHL